jgi:hypothetical protein
MPYESQCSAYLCQRLHDGADLCNDRHSNESNRCPDSSATIGLLSFLVSVFALFIAVAAVWTRKQWKEGTLLYDKDGVVSSKRAGAKLQSVDADTEAPVSTGPASATGSDAPAAAAQRGGVRGFSSYRLSSLPPASDRNSAHNDPNEAAGLLTADDSEQ